MAEQIQWLDGWAKDGKSVEKICPKRHVRQDHWQSEWNETYLNAWCRHCYDFISDYECIFNYPVSAFYRYRYRGLWDNLQAAKQQGTRVSIANIAHFTELTSAKEIVKSGGFRGGMKKINVDAKKRNVIAKFSWWSPIFGEDDIKVVRDTLGAAIQPFLTEFHEDGSDQDDAIDSDQDTENGGGQENEREGSDQNDEIDQEMSCQQNDEKDDYPVDDQDELTLLQKQFASSNAFNPKAQFFGSVYFQYDINDLCNFYRMRFNGDHEVQFKILGTFSYKKEVMHAVLICSTKYGNGLFKEYPHVSEKDINNEAVVTRDNNGNWVWKPQATGTEIKRLRYENEYPKYRRWQHVAFAFHIPEEWKNEPESETIVSVPNLPQNLHFSVPASESD